jgi:hypothetical protein
MSPQVHTYSYAIGPAVVVAAAGSTHSQAYVKPAPEVHTYQYGLGMQGTKATSMPASNSKATRSVVSSSKQHAAAKPRTIRDAASFRLVVLHRHLDHGAYSVAASAHEGSNQMVQCGSITQNKCSTTMTMSLRGPVVLGALVMDIKATPFDSAAVGRGTSAPGKVCVHFYKARTLSSSVFHSFDHVLRRR